MKHIDTVRREFTKQAHSFNEYQKNFSLAEFNDWAFSHIGFKSSDNVLEVAAGTCAFGRSAAPLVSKVTEIDATQAMLDVGRQQAKELGIHNQEFILGLAEELPFNDETFDCVVSRLAFHHFEDADKPFKEMIRTVGKKGKIAVIDLEARQESLKNRADYFEKLRDPSHVRCLSGGEFIKLAEENGAQIDFCQTIPMPVSLKAWMDLTKVSGETRAYLTSAIQADINGAEKTGFEPYIKDGEIFFDHRWMLFVCSKI